jgi:pilus assembly protein CpaE
MATRLLVAEQDLDIRKQITDMVAENEEFEVIGFARDGQEAIEMTMQFHPSVVLIAFDLPGISGPATCETIDTIAPRVYPILMTDSRTPDKIDMALRSGARALLTKPLDTYHFNTVLQALIETMTRCESHDCRQWEDPSRYPKIISVTGAKGGIGKSSVAVNLAVALAKEAPDNVAVIDLCTQFGDVATMFNVTPRYTIMDMMENSREPEADLVTGYMTKHPSGVHVLVAASTPVHYEAIGADYLENLLYVLKRLYKYVIVDIPPILHTASVQVLAHSNMVVLVANLTDLATIADTKKFYDTLVAQNVPKHGIKIALNRVARNSPVSVSDVQDIIGCEIIGQIPNDSRLPSAVNQGVPLFLFEADSPFSNSIRQMASVVALGSSAAEQPKNFSTMMAGLLGSLFGR